MTHSLLKKEFVVEFRRKSAFAGLLLFLFGTAFIAYLTFRLRGEQVTPMVWSSLFWIIVLFSSVNAIAKSFIGESRGREMYMYSIANPASLIISKIIYNFLLGTLMCLIAWLLFAFLLGDPVSDHAVFFVAIVLTAYGFAAALTILSSIASRANNSTVLMAVLSFPVVISILLMAIKVTKNCIDGLGWTASSDEILTLAAINVLVTATSYILFPYIWRS